MSFFLGLDTSAYTTSLALVNGDKVYKKEKMLTVKKGQKGLRQSEAVFQHQNNLPLLFEYLFNSIDEAIEGKRGKDVIKGIGASASPRPVPGSYMPVFTVGSSFGRVLASVLMVDFFPTTHQENHLACGLYSNNIILNNFLALHVSGGTTELLSVKYDNFGFDIEIIGASEDLSAGQFIDRVGVKLGYDFPSGKHLEALSYHASDVHLIPLAVKDKKLSFSGPLTYVERQLKTDDIEKATIAKGVFHNIALSLEKLISNVFDQKIINQNLIKDILFVGGVMSNSYIKEYLNKALKEKYALNSWFTPPELSVDNSVGVAWLTKQKYLQFLKNEKDFN